MTPTLPDGWLPFQLIQIQAEKDRDDDKIKEPTPIKLVRVSKFYFKDKE